MDDMFMRLAGELEAKGYGAAAQAIRRGDVALGAACELAGFNRPADMGQAQAIAVVQRANDAGMMRGPCARVPGLGGMNLPGVNTWPACYRCKDIDPCLIPYLEDQALQLDPWALLKLYTNESDLVHINVDVGDAPFVTPEGLASNESAMLAQELGQELAYIPGLLKVSVKFSDGEDHQELVSLQLYSGARGLTGLTDTSGLTEIGRPFTFEDFVCGTACYLAPFPDMLGCSNRVIPGQRSVYAKVTAAPLPGGVTIEGLSIVIIKTGTKQYANCCNTYSISV